MSSKDKKIHKSGLTSQEYSFKFAIPLETLVSNQSSKMSNEKNSFICKNLNAEQKTILKTYFDLKLLDTSENEIKIREEVRKLNYLYWLKNKLSNLGFSFIDNNEYQESSHKIITDNYIYTDKKNINLIDIQNHNIDDFKLCLSLVLMSKGYMCNNYIYIKDIDNTTFDFLKKNLQLNNISIVKLEINNDIFIARIKTKRDCENTKIYLQEYIDDIPCFNDKFFLKTPKAKITKKLVFDSAHFITDHDGKCKNLHGGRYDIEITVKDRIDPMTGFVIDYSLIKKITKNLVINKFDHKTLNLTCPELAWRSSTEFLSIVIWEILIEYLPNLKKIKIYETETSYCEFTGNSLEEFMKYGQSEILTYFKNLNRDEEKEKNIIGK